MHAFVRRWSPLSVPGRPKGSQIPPFTTHGRFDRSVRYEAGLRRRDMATAYRCFAEAPATATCQAAGEIP